MPKTAPARDRRALFLSPAKLGGDLCRWMVNYVPVLFEFQEPFVLIFCLDLPHLRISNYLQYEDIIESLYNFLCSEACDLKRIQIYVDNMLSPMECIHLLLKSFIASAPTFMRSSQSRRRNYSNIAGLPQVQEFIRRRSSGIISQRL